MRISLMIFAVSIALWAPDLPAQERSPWLPADGGQGARADRRRPSDRDAERPSQEPFGQLLVGERGTGRAGPSGLFRYQYRGTEDGKVRTLHAELDQAAFLRIWRDGTPQPSSILTAAFDATSAELIGSTLQPGERSVVRGFDFETLRVERIGAECLKNQQLLIGGAPFVCRHVAIKGPRTTTTRWIARDALGPFVVREEGTAEGGAYALVANRYAEQR